MIFKKYFFNLMAEDLKDRIWSIALAMFVFFLAMPVYFMLGTHRNSTLHILSQAAGTSSFLLPVITVVGAVICALNGFHYLNSRSQVDCWHSLPARREMLFAAKYINGVCIYLFAYLINLALTVLLFAAEESFTSDIFREVYMTFLLNTAAYLLFYSLSLIAVFLTGHTLVTLMGILVFFFYGPCVTMLHYYMKSEYFQTFYDDQSLTRFFGAPWCSPINAYVHLIQNPPFLFPVLLAALIFTILGLIFYRKRPSEAAGNAMAFPVSQPIFKFFLLVPLSLGGGMFFQSVSLTDSSILFLFGLLLFWFAGSIFAEVVYALDFRRALAHKRTSFAALTVSICIFTIFRMDLFGYDCYLPKETDLQSIAVHFERLDANTHTYERVKDSADDSSDSYQFVNPSKYRLHHMNLTGKDLEYAYAFASSAASLEKERSRMSQELFELKNAGQPSLYFDIKYKLNSGREIYRSYHIYMDWNGEQQALQDALSALYVSEDYKRGCFPILNSDECPEYFSELTLYDLTRQAQNTALTKAQSSEFLAALQKDLLDTSLETCAVQNTCGSVVLKDSVNSIRNGEYPIYDSYYNTIQLMESYGLNVWSIPDTDNITQLEVRHGENSDVRFVYTDKTQMKEILTNVTSADSNASFISRYFNKQMFSVYALHDSGEGDMEVISEYYILYDNMPDFLKQGILAR